MPSKQVYEVSQASSHVIKEKELGEYLKSNGYNIVDTSYHHHYDTGDCSILRRLDNFPSLFLRTRPDFLVSKDGYSFLVELKVGSNKNRAYFEALPLKNNQQIEKFLNVPTLYVYAGGITNGDMVAQWSTRIVPEKLVIPKRNANIKEVLESYYTCEIEERETNKNTSGDAFVIVPKNDILSWRPIEDYLDPAFNS